MVSSVQQIVMNIPMNQFDLARRNTIESQAMPFESNNLSDIERRKREESLQDFLDKQDWESVMVSLFNEKNGHPKFSKAHAQVFEGQSGHNLLHVVCRHQPPSLVVEALVGAWPFLSSDLTSESNQSALHIATMHGARSDVVKVLLRANGNAASQKDKFGRLPLHWACCPRYYAASKTPTPDDTEWINPGSAVIRALCEHFPSAVNMEDIDGCNPIELALQGEAHIGKNMLKVLLDTSVAEWNAKIESITKDDTTVDSFYMPGYSRSAKKELLERCRCLAPSIK